MVAVDGKEWIPVRRTNLKYYDTVALYYRSPSGNIRLYKPPGMSFSDQALAKKPYLGQLYIQPEDKLRCLREVQHGFSMELTQQILSGRHEDVKAGLVGIVDETLSEPRSGSLKLMPESIDTVVGGYSAQPDVIKSLARISHTDYTTAIHSINLMALTIGYCFYTHRSDEQTRRYGLAAMLHDVGKVEIDPTVLVAPRRLTDAEFEQMKRHTTIGADIVGETFPDLSDAIAAARDHHEKLDGSGYPSGNTDISELSRLISIIDTYEALTNDDRPYRAAMDPMEALELMKTDVDRGCFDRDIFVDFAYSLTDFTRATSRKMPDRLFQN